MKLGFSQNLHSCEVFSVDNAGNVPTVSILAYLSNGFHSFFGIHLTQPAISGIFLMKIVKFEAEFAHGGEK